MLRDLLEYLIRGLVDDPKQIRLDLIETPKLSLFCIRANTNEVGRILGKKGQTIEDIRRVMEAVASRLGKEVIIDVVEQKQKDARSTVSSFG